MNDKNNNEQGKTEGNQTETEQQEDNQLEGENVAGTDQQDDQLQQAFKQLSAFLKDHPKLEKLFIDFVSNWQIKGTRDIVKEVELAQKRFYVIALFGTTGLLGPSYGFLNLFGMNFGVFCIVSINNR
ncbi:MAG: hypothetical protein ACXAEU_21775 [Candidatus Hodarchaeales archaeon]|jgi:nicotinic acid phosphoribosyltransferase